MRGALRKRRRDIIDRGSLTELTGLALSAAAHTAGAINSPAAIGTGQEEDEARLPWRAILTAARANADRGAILARPAGVPARCRRMGAELRPEGRYVWKALDTCFT